MNNLVIVPVSKTHWASAYCNPKAFIQLSPLALDTSQEEKELAELAKRRSNPQPKKFTKNRRTRKVS